eukprot:CAMPEP_0117681324 /NCGR_PEP_ID=MMETSP0804-20121206/18906_1 /TAXON_ID=1074897 /ORGANISM="Tetraselmis astigmatica, Strain CCMP880" /LENGTH=160 /DNA_ID=CAMNT_0005491043 /DNA_START=278 /DNA_END=760 /DNA_ORIENTATION=+
MEKVASSSVSRAFAAAVVSPPAAYAEEVTPAASISCRCFPTGTSVLAQIIPEAAAAGTPMPGAVESPHTNNPSTGVFGPGKDSPLPGEKVAPYVPRSRRLKKAWVRGVPTILSSIRCLMSGMIRSRAWIKHSERSSFKLLYSGEPRFSPSHTEKGSLPAV